MPWGINKQETKRLVKFTKWKLIDETENLLVYSKVYLKFPSLDMYADNDTVAFFYNNEKLYSIKEGFKSGPYFNTNGEPLTAYIDFEDNKFVFDGYYYYVIEEELEDFGYELFWTDKLGIIQNKSIDTYTAFHGGIFEAMNLNENYKDIDFKDFIIKNNLVLKKTILYHSININFILRKDDETSYILELILTNNKL